MRLETENGGTFQDPTDGEITAALSQLDGYAILSHNEMTYMQAARTSQDSFVLEYQEGDTEQHFVCPDRLSLNEITTAFIAYAKENPSWRSAFRCEKLDNMSAPVSAPDIDPQLRATVARLKQAERRWRNRIGWSLGAWFVAGVAVGLGTWFAQKPMDRDSIMFSGVAGLGLATFFFGGMLSRMLLRKPDTKCPKCGYHWTLDDPNNMFTWKCCPGCGLDMSDDIGCHDQP